MRAMLAAAALMLAACGQQGTGAPLPPVREGAQAPSTQARPSGEVKQAQIPADQVEQYMAGVRRYLDLATDQLGAGMRAAEGFSDETVGMQPGADHRWQVELAGGHAYRIVGACDDDCSNLDIELIDVATGGVVASDMLEDDFPVVDFTPQSDGRYIVRLLMQSCSVAPCFAGARVLSGAREEAGR